ncbi:hypothetical protein [Beggiatoa leptomitoformis]|uniref:Topoisomerase 6 subunit A/Spo11 TOPRIM domain-containing protein n=1 Tax=Beggiatoa leptomitoformis TaxID=288004 RepID=A0A2N9YCD7_9GAMM|nr:hypothetical protein [Beggiatoa leptomitoformis]ALG66569.2 hypothetical protein AL038_00965 [Beggiatoa leptomitoformis]AUI68131.2 hypothetical protein BLE401_05080 [Beggiatoa leptomitoformis]
MRCPNCNHTQKYKEGLTCSKCHYHFVLTSKVDGISDYAMKQIIQRLSSDGQFVFTKGQLFAEIARHFRSKSNNTGCFIAGLLIAAFITAILLSDKLGGWAFLLPACLIVITSLYAWLARKKIRAKRGFTITNQKITVIIDKYQTQHPLTDLMADGKAFLRPTVSEKESNIAEQTLNDAEGVHYAPEHILVVERNDMVDMLIRNHFHLQCKTAVISQSGYPAHVFSACKHFVKKQADLPIYLVHDASLYSFQLIEKLKKEPQWQFAHDRLQDLGFSRDLVTTAKGELGWMTTIANKSVVFTKEAEKMLREGMRIPLDSAPPRVLNNLLGTAVLTGAMLLLPALWNESTAGDGGTESDDFG